MCSENNMNKETIHQSTPINPRAAIDIELVSSLRKCQSAKFEKGTTFAKELMLRTYLLQIAQYDPGVLSTFACGYVSSF